MNGQEDLVPGDRWSPLGRLKQMFEGEKKGKAGLIGEETSDMSPLIHHCSVLC